jgi:hypothetical protein
MNRSPHRLLARRKALAEVKEERNEEFHKYFWRNVFRDLTVLFFLTVAIICAGIMWLGGQGNAD